MPETRIRKGSTIDGFLVGELIHEGGMATLRSVTRPDIDFPVLMKVPKLANDKRVRRILSILSPVLGIRSIETDRDHLWIKLRATPAGLPEALGKLRAVR